MKLLLAFYILTGSISPMEDEYKGYYTIYFEDNSIVEFAKKEEIFHYFKTGTFVYFYFDDKNGKGYNYKKHYHKKRRLKLKNKLFNSNNCNGASHHA